MTDKVNDAPSTVETAASQTPSVWEARYRQTLREWEEELEKRAEDYEREMKLHLDSLKRNQENNGVGKIFPMPIKNQNIPPSHVMRAKVELDKLEQAEVETPVEVLARRVDELERENKALRGKLQRGSIR